MRTILIILIFIATNKARGGNDLNNYNIHYHLAKGTEKIDSNFSLPKILVELNKAEVKDFRKADLQSLLSWFKNDSTDWAANIILYAVTKKDASAFMLFESPQEWRLAMKKIDLDYWKDYFYIKNKPFKISK